MRVSKEFEAVLRDEERAASAWENQATSLAAKDALGPAVLAEGSDRQEVDGITEDRYTWVVRVPLMLAYAYRGVSNTPNYR